MLIRNARIVRPEGPTNVDIQVEDGKIKRVARHIPPRGEVIDAHGDLVLPGAIDAHVHFRDPGLTHKEDWGSGSRSAAAGGVTTVIDHPNTRPPTLTRKSFKEKLRAARESVVDYAINAGVTPGADLGGMWSLGAIAFGETFLAQSTGDLTITPGEFTGAARRIRELGGLVCVHAENQECIQEASAGATEDPLGHSQARPPECEARAVRQVLDLIGDQGVHFAHLSSQLGVEALAGSGASAEVAPHHLFLDTGDYEGLGWFGVMNPPLRSPEDREYMWRALADSRVDMVASDHAPHLPGEKQGGAAGVPGVETMLPLLLHAAMNDRLSLQRLQEVLCENPARVYGLQGKGHIGEGYDADLVIVGEERVIRAGDLHSRAGWTPYEGMKGVFPRMTLVRGRVAFDGEGFHGRGRFIPGPGKQ